MFYSLREGTHIYRDTKKWSGKAPRLRRFGIWKIAKILKEIPDSSKSETPSRWLEEWSQWRMPAYFGNKWHSRSRGFQSWSKSFVYFQIYWTWLVFSNLLLILDLSFFHFSASILHSHPISTQWYWRKA